MNGLIRIAPSHLYGGGEAINIDYADGSDYVCLVAVKPEAEPDAKLIVAAWNSYVKHYGTNAMSAAESDALGALLQRLNRLHQRCREAGADTHPLIAEAIRDDEHALLNARNYR